MIKFPCIHFKFNYKRKRQSPIYRDFNPFKFFVKSFNMKSKLQNNNPVYETAKETLMYRTVLWTLWERERVGRFGRMALKHVKYHV